MTNGEKYKTAKERAEAFRIFCGEGKCEKCQFQEDHFMNSERCRFLWLDLEVEEEKPLPCPFCGAECSVDDISSRIDWWYVRCEDPDCCYSSGIVKERKSAIAAHNRVAKAVKESEGNE